MSNNKLYILVGLSASGKSTFAEQLLLSDDRLIRVSRDEYRYMWRNSGVVSDKIEHIITQRVNDDIEYFLNNKFDVIYDATNLSVRYLNDLTDRFNYLADIEFIVFDVDVEECIRRDSLRSRKVGEKVIRSQHERFLDLKKNFEFGVVGRRKKPYKNFQYYVNKQHAICVNLDGTLADIGDRDPYGKGVFNDQIVYPVKNVLLAYLNANPDVKLFIVSGREEKMREETEKWLNYHNIPFHFLLMRENGDNRRDVTIKKHIYKQNILPFYNVHFVLDDRYQVVEMLREMLGLTVFQVDKGNF